MKPKSPVNRAIVISNFYNTNPVYYWEATKSEKIKEKLHKDRVIKEVAEIVVMMGLFNQW